MAFLSGVPRQGRIGIGYSIVFGTDVPPATEPSLTIADVDRAIDAIEAVTGSGSAASRRELLAGLLGRATDEEADFLRRLFTGQLRQGSLAGVMTAAVAKAAGVRVEITRRALMLSGDLAHTAEIAMTDGEPGLRAVGFEIFRPILPMLASTGAAVGEAVASFELRIGGVQARRDPHPDPPPRRRGAHLHAQPERDHRHAARIVDSVRRLPVTQVVLDGEALWMSETGPASFQDTVSQIDSDAPPEGIVTFVFDLLHLDGEDLLDQPLLERTQRLAQIAPELKIPGVLTSDPREGERVLEESLAAGHEGVVVKDTASVYAAGRRGGAWRKVKPVRTYDLVVLGAEWGHGRRQGWLSNLHLGARDPRTGEFVMVGKTFKGLTDELLRWQTDALLERETSRHGIAVLVNPDLVVEIALDGVQSSTRYPGGVALRFARVKRYRPDKDAAEADTIDELRALLPASVR